jgi:hypothetical protein
MSGSAWRLHTHGDRNWVGEPWFVFGVTSEARVSHFELNAGGHATSRPVQLMNPELEGARFFADWFDARGLNGPHVVNVRLLDETGEAVDGGSDDRDRPSPELKSKIAT